MPLALDRCRSAQNPFEARFAAGNAADLPESAAIPYVQAMPGVGWVGIFNQEVTGFPKMQLKRFDAHTMVSHLTGGVPEKVPAFRTTTPWTGPWHIIVIGNDREKLARAETLRELPR